ncbi:MAG TPA: acireductone synthase [Vicinamibacterales bacterium]
MTVSLSALQTRALLLDIEGTTTPVEFVYHVLFPYARAHAAEYLARHHGSADCREAVALLRKESGVAQDAKGSGVAQDFSPAKILEYAFSLMDRDKKSPGLKALQGLIWQDGYKSGELRGQVYPDVPPAFKRWRARGLDIYIYSSGSVLAQQLLFGSTNAGDLTKFLKGYFDTAVGPKTSPDSYRAISERLHIAPPETLFVSDVVQELDAARTSGMRTVLCVRGTDAPSGSEAHPVIRSFNEIVD